MGIHLLCSTSNCCRTPQCIMAARCRPDRMRWSKRCTLPSVRFPMVADGPLTKDGVDVLGIQYLALVQGSRNELLHVHLRTDGRPNQPTRQSAVRIHVMPCCWVLLHAPISRTLAAPDARTCGLWHPLCRNTVHQVQPRQQDVSHNPREQWHNKLCGHAPCHRAPGPAPPAGA